MLFDEKEVGNIDGQCEIPYLGMKEPNYVMKIMVTYSGLTVLDGQKESVRKYEGGG